MIIFLLEKYVSYLFLFYSTPLVLLVSLFSLFSLSKYKVSESNVLGATTVTPTGLKVYASLPSETTFIYARAVPSDAREEILKEYLSYYESPLLPYPPKLSSRQIKTILILD